MIAPEHNDLPTLYGHSLPKQEQHVAQPSHPAPTALDWFKEFNAFWGVGIVPIVLAYIGWRSLKLKTESDNRKKLERYRRENREDEFSEDTMFDVVKRLNRKKHAEDE